jgi:ABC-type glutathione transport system ATPase component
MAIASEHEVPIARIEQLLRDVERDREELQKAGLLPRDLSADAFRDLPLSEPNVRPVIETFITDTQKKFAVLADLRERLTLFTEFLNQHYENKRVVTAAREGFRVEMEGDPERLIQPSQLSSGEQQILVLAYEILFRSEPGTLVLVDEPELSLHVVWQDTFIEDLSRMGGVRNLQFILATHSPSLIGGREDLRRSLDALKG